MSVQYVDRKLCEQIYEVCKKLKKSGKDLSKIKLVSKDIYSKASDKHKKYSFNLN